MRHIRLQGERRQFYGERNSVNITIFYIRGEKYLQFIVYIQIKEWCFPGCVPRSSPAQPKSKGKLVFLSGLDLANNFEDLSLNLLSEWICGMAGDVTVQEDATRIVRVIIAGMYQSFDIPINIK